MVPKLLLFIPFFFFAFHLFFCPPTNLLPCHPAHLQPTAPCTPSALPSSSSISFCKPFDKLCPDIHNISPTTAAISALNWCQEYEPSGFLYLLVSSWFLCNNVNNDSAAASTLTFCACSVSNIPQVVPSYDAHHLAFKRQGEPGNVHRKVCKNQESVL